MWLHSYFAYATQVGDRWAGFLARRRRLMSWRPRILVRGSRRSPS